MLRSVLFPKSALRLGLGPCRAGPSVSPAPLHHSAAPPLASSHFKVGGHGASAAFARRKLRDYRFPEVRNEDCEQDYVSGWGPGGQKVNTAQNAVQLRHKPTNIIVKVHESRLLSENVAIAFERLKHAVDRHLNGADCYSEQFDRLKRAHESKSKRQRAKRREIRASTEVT